MWFYNNLFCEKEESMRFGIMRTDKREVGLSPTNTLIDKASLKAIVEDIELGKSKIVKFSCAPIDKKKTHYKLELIYSPIIK
jgi:hypothetical protein